MKKVVRLTESDLVRIVKRVIQEEKYGSFGSSRRKDLRGDDWVKDDDTRPSDDELFGIGDDDEFDTEEFDDYESYSKKYPMGGKDTPKWFGNDRSYGKKIFNTYKKELGGKPFKVKTRRPK